MKRFLFGMYVCGAQVTFCYVGFWTILGGNANELWKPIVYAVLWPIAMPLWLAGWVS